MLSEQLTNLANNYKMWESLKSNPIAVRPTNLPLTIDTNPPDIPSPTPSEDIPSPTDSESCDSTYNEDTDVVELLARRRSLPVVLLENNNLLSRRASLPDGPQANNDNKHSGLLIAEHLAHSSICSEKDKVLLSEILENLYLSNSMR